MTALEVVFTIALGCAVAVQYWKLDRHPRYFLTRNTLAIKTPGRRIRCIHPADCAYYNPGKALLVLNDGSSVSLFGPDFLRRRGDGLEAHLFAMWFPGAHGENQLRAWNTKYPFNCWAYVVGQLLLMLSCVTFMAISRYSIANPPTSTAELKVQIGLIGLSVLGQVVAIACLAINLPFAYGKMRHPGHIFLRTGTRVSDHA